jgi:hypothetical protein
MDSLLRAGIAEEEVGTPVGVSLVLACNLLFQNGQ